MRRPLITLALTLATSFTLASSNQCIDVYKTSHKLVINNPAKNDVAVILHEGGKTFLRNWKLAKIGIKEYIPSGSTIKLIAPFRRLRGDYRIPSIGLDIVVKQSDGPQTISLYAMAGQEITLYKMAAVIEQLPPAFLKTLSTIELWPTSQTGDFTMLGHGFLLEDPQPGSFLGETIKLFGGALRTYGRSVSILRLSTGDAADKIDLKISSDLINRLGLTVEQRKELADKTANQVKFAYEDGYLHDHVRKIEALRNDMSRSIVGNSAIAELLANIAPHAFEKLSETQQLEYSHAVEADGGLHFNTSRTQDWTWSNINSDFSSALVSIAQLSYSQTYLESKFPNRLAFMKKIFGY